MLDASLDWNHFPASVPAKVFSFKLVLQLLSLQCPPAFKPHLNVPSNTDSHAHAGSPHPKARDSWNVRNTSFKTTPPPTKPFLSTLSSSIAWEVLDVYLTWRVNESLKTEGDSHPQGHFYFTAATCGLRTLPHTGLFITTEFERLLFQFLKLLILY